MSNPRYAPEQIARTRRAEEKGGHGGGDYFVVSDFVAAVAGERANLIDVQVPDFRDWQVSES